MSANTLGNWLKWGYVPKDAQYKLDSITHGGLKREDLIVIEKLSQEQIAFVSLKGKMGKLMFDFSHRYIDSENKLPLKYRCVLVDVLNDCLIEAQNLVLGKNDATD